MLCGRKITDMKNTIKMLHGVSFDYLISALNGNSDDNDCYDVVESSDYKNKILKSILTQLEKEEKLKMDLEPWTRKISLID